MIGYIAVDEMVKGPLLVFWNRSSPQGWTNTSSPPTQGNVVVAQKTPSDATLRFQETLGSHLHTYSTQNMQRRLNEK